MKKQPALVLAAVACVLALLCFWQIVEMKSQLSMAEQNINGQNSEIRQLVNEISNNIRTSLQQEASLLVGSGWQYGQPNMETYTVPVTFSITPKEVTPGVTTAALIGTNKTLPLTLQDGTFSVTDTLNLFSTLDVSKVVFTENGVQRTEQLDWTLAPRYELLPDWHADSTGASLSYQKNEICLKVNGLDVYNTSIKEDWPAVITSASLLEKRNGEIIHRTDITSELRPLEQNGQTEDSYLTWRHTTQYTIPYHERFELYLELVDQYDLHYQMLIEHFTSAPEGHTQEDEGVLHSTSANIYDDNGNLLFQGRSE